MMKNLFKHFFSKPSATEVASTKTESADQLDKLKQLVEKIDSSAEELCPQCRLWRDGLERRKLALEQQRTSTESTRKQQPAKLPNYQRAAYYYNSKNEEELTELQCSTTSSSSIKYGTYVPL